MGEQLKHENHRSQMILAKNLERHAFMVPGDKQWYDLHTCKVVQQIPDGHVCVKGKNVIGLPEEVDCFLHVNNQLTYPPKEIPSLAIHSFCPSRVKATITRIIDGDTVDATVFIPFSSLPCIVGEKGQGGFLTSVRCRLAGIDAAEHNTDKGVVAINYLTKLLVEFNFHVEIQFGKPDKYGRALATIYTGDTNINQAMLDYNDSIVGKIANPYDGKTKKSFD